MCDIYDTTKETFYENTTWGSLKNGDHIIINNDPCKIVELTSVKTGKHGAAKVILVAIDIFKGKKYEKSNAAGIHIEKTDIERHTYFLTDITDDNYLSMLDDQNNQIEYFRLPENDIGEKIRLLFDQGKNVKVMTLHAKNKEMITNCQVE